MNINFSNLDEFCSFMRLVGGSTDVHVRFPSHPKLGGRYISLNMKEGYDHVSWGEDIIFLPYIPGPDNISGGPFPLTQETLRSIADSGVAPNDFGADKSFNKECEALVKAALDFAVEEGRHFSVSHALQMMSFASVVI